MTGTLFIICAPSGAGKTSLVRELIQKEARLKLSISHTTRLPRRTEINGKDYHFISNNEFQDMIKKELFLEHAKVHGNLYGTSKEWVESQLSRNNDLILEIDWQGAQQIKSKIKNTSSVFILPPTKESLRERLMARGEDSNEVIESRLLQADTEISHANEFDYVIINDKFKNALRQLRQTVEFERRKKESSKDM